MNRNEQQTIDANNGINDLTVANDQQAQIKGSPNPKNKRTVVLQSSATGQDSDLGDLEPNDDSVVGGALKGKPMHLVNCGDGASGGSTLGNHNETMAEDDEADGEVETASIDDLPVTGEQAEQAKGGAVRVGKLLGVNY